MSCLIILGALAAAGAYLLFVQAPRSPIDPPWGGEYHLLGVFRGKATLPSRVVAGFEVPVEKFFVSVWS